jgi:predicted ester cyclase
MEERTAPIHDDSTPDLALVDRAFNTNQLDLLDEIIAPGIIDHGSIPLARAGLPGFKQRFAMLKVGFPDGEVVVQQRFTSEDLVARHWTFRGTNTGPLLGRPASYRRVTLSGVDMERLAGGKVVEHWSYWDRLDLLEQLGFDRTA